MGFTEATLILTFMGTIATTMVGVMGWMIRRAIVRHDDAELVTQQLIHNNNQQIQEMRTRADLVSQQQIKLLSDTLTEAKLTNHRITHLESIEQVRKESHQQRGD